MYILQGGATSKTIEVFIQDSSVTTGAGLTGLAFDTASLVASYVRPGAARSAITLATQTASGAWSSGGFAQIDSTNMPGWYRLDVPDAAIAAGVDHVGIMLKGATNMAPCNVVIDLTAINLQDTVRAGLTALPNAAAAATGGLLTGPTTANTGLADVRQLLGTAWLTPGVAGTPDVNAKQVGGVAQTGGDIYPAVSNIGATAAPQNANASSRVITTGTESGTLSNASTLDGVFWNIADAAGVVDFYAQFDLSAVSGAFVTSAFWNGYVVGIVNTIKVYAYNWAGTSWDQVGTIIGIAGTVVSAEDFELTSAHIGTGGNLGLVRIRFNATGLTGATVKTDRILLGYGVTPATVGAAMTLAAGAITAAVIADGAIVQSVLPAGDIGDYASGDTLDFTFGTDGTLGGTPAVSIYKANNQTQVTTGVTLDVDYDSTTGLNHVRVVLTDSFYVVNNDYMAVLTAGTVGGVSVVGTTVATFSVQKKTVKQVGGGGSGGGSSADVNIVAWNGTAVAVPATAGIPDVNAKNLGNTAQTTGTDLGSVIPEMNGLIGKNSGLRNTVYSGTNLQSYTLFLYDSSAHALLNDGTTGVLHQYNVANTHDSNGNILTSVTTRVS